MRIPNVVIFIIMLCISCSGEKQNKDQHSSRVFLSNSEEVESSDGVRDLEGDELFDDFFYNFVTDKDFQKNRVLFPITELINDEKIVLDKNNWNYDKTFNQIESYVQIIKDNSKVDISKDINLKNVKVELINIPEQLIKQYSFIKSEHSWHLNTIHIYPLKNNVNKFFWSFYEKFATDSVFQRRCLRTPIDFETYDIQQGETISGFLDVEQWFSFAPTFPSGIIININYGEPFVPKEDCVLVIRELSNSMASLLKFCKINGFWMLTKLED